MMGLFARYPLTVDTRDVGPYRHHATTTVAPASLVTGGPLGTCYDFNTGPVGSGYVILMDDATADLWEAGDWSITHWVRPEYVSSGHTGARSISRDASDHWATYITQTQTPLQTILWYVGGASRTLVGKLTADAWNHLAFTYTAATKEVSAYVNGVLDSVYTGTAPKTTARPILLANNTELAPSPSTTYSLVGQISDARFYDHVLTPAEVTETAQAKIMHWVGNSHYDYTVNRSKPVENWTNLQNGTVTHMPTEVGPEGAKVYKLTATGTNILGKRDVGSSNNALDGPVSEHSSDFTYSFWVKGFRATVGRSVSMDIGDAAAADTATLTDDWQLMSCTGSSTNYTFCDFNFGSGAVGDIVYMTQPQCEHRAFRTLPVTPVDTSRTATRTSYVGDESGLENIGTLSPLAKGPQSVEDGPGGSCWEVDGTNYIDGVDFASPEFVTVSVWWKGGTVPLNIWHHVFSKNSTRLEIAVNNAGATFTGLSIDNVRQSHSTKGSGLNDGQWHHIAFTYDGANFITYHDGVQIYSTAVTGALTCDGPLRVGTMTSGAYPAVGRIADVRVYGTALTASQIKDIATVKGRVTAGQEFHAGELVEAVGSYKPSLIDYSTWVVGSTGGQTGFPQNGSSTENSIVTRTNPWGRKDTLWHAVGTGVSGADGGWGGSMFAADETKTYRFTCWINMLDSNGVVGMGRMYLGLNTYNSGGSNLATTSHSTGATTTNPYFISGRYSVAETGVNEWRLAVGFLYPVGTPTGAADGITGIYSMDGVKTYYGASFVFSAGTSFIRHRAYQYYVTTAGGQQLFYRPRVDLVDGTEPSLTDLLHGNENPDLYDVSDGISRVTDTGRARFPAFDEVALPTTRIDHDALYAAGLKEGIL